MTARTCPTPVPTTVTPALLHYRDAEGIARCTTHERAGQVPFEDVSPISRPLRYKGQQNTPGYYWSATDARLHEYESYLECQWMTIFDFDPHVVAMRAQPFTVQALDPDGSWVHTPDLFLRLADGSGRVVDVKNPEKSGHADVLLQAARSRQLCQQIGWDYQLVTEPDAMRWLNIRWLAAYRRPCDLPPELTDKVLAAATAPISIGELVAAFEPPELVRAAVLRACWFGQLGFPLDLPLRDTTLVQLNGDQS